MDQQITINLEENNSLMVRLQIAVLVIIIPAAYLFYLPEQSRFSSPLQMLTTPIGLSPRVLDWIILVGIFFATLLLHEAIHAVMFKILGPRRTAITFGFSIGFAYAGAPNVVFSRIRYIAVGLAPAVLITLLLMPLIHCAPKNLIPLLFVTGVINLSGSVGDAYISYRVLSTPKGTLIRDKGIEFTLYPPM